MKKLYPLLSILFLIYWGCEEEQPEEVDTTPPTVSISSHSSGQSVNEIITIIVTTQDNEGISKVEFFIDDSLVLTDSESPYQYDWNTTQYEDNSEHIVKVISYDNSDNSTTSQPIMLTVDNSTSTPNGGNITSVTYTLTEMTVIWEESSDGDFKDYKVLYSDTENGDRDTLETYTDKSTTSYTITEFDPLIENWFWVQVTDTLGLSSIGTGMTNSLDSEPTPVNITSVTYDLESMTIIWEEYVPNMGRINQMNQNTRSTVTNDFVSYELLQSDSENGTYSSVVVITDQTTTSYSITDYNPTQQNWFKVKVTDYWNLTSTGTGMTNEIDSPPSQIDISSVTYDLPEMVVTWNQSNDNDFVSYELLYSETQNGEQISITSITDINTTSFTISDFNPLEERWYWIRVTDYWSLTTMSNGYMVLDSPPTPSVLYPISWDDGFQILWSQNNDDDFQSYKLYESLSDSMSGQTLLFEITDRTGTTYLKTTQNFMYYQIVVEDVWGLQSTSNIEVGDYEVELWGEYYSIENTTELNLGNSGLTGSIPPEIGNLTNLTELYLRNNQLTEEIPPEIGNLTNLTQLNLGDNQLSEEIPSEIGNLTNLTHLSLRNNQLTEEIPPEIGNLTNLIQLNLEDNQLSGEIPSEIGNLTNLEYLYLNNNQLTGEIPESICNLNVYWGITTDHNISNNQLCPPYPSCVEDYVGEQDTSDCD